MTNKNFQITVHAICMTILFIMILIVANCPNTYAATINLKCGQKVRDSRSKNYYQAPACPKPCTNQNPSDVCLASTPTPILLPAPVPTLVPTPIPTVPPSAPSTKIEYIGTMYATGTPYPGTQADIDRLNKLKTYASGIMTWWYALPVQSWCNWARTEPTTIKWCGFYDDWGFQFSGDPMTNSYIAKGWGFKPAIYNTYNNPGEVVLDLRNPAYVQAYINRIKDGYPGKWTGMAGAGNNAKFFDNGYLYASAGFWTGGNHPGMSSWVPGMINALTTVRQAYDAMNALIVLNVYSDVTDPNWYWKHLAEYRAYVSQAHYSLFERTTTDLNTKAPLTEATWKGLVDIAVDMNKNTGTIVVWSTEYGDFWYNFSSGLLSCMPSKCAFWQQPVMTDSQIQKLSTLDLGVPVSDYTKAGCYIRPWTKGLVIANPTDSSCSVPLSGSYTDLETGATLSGSVTVKSKDGKVLVEE